MGPGPLARVLRQSTLTTYRHPDLLVGLQTSDDAAVYRLSSDQAMIQTVDFFAPVVDDPVAFGEIAAANSMSDVYAMGGDVLMALNVAGFPEDLPTEMIAAILDGGAAKVAEAGGIIAGGHTVIDPEPKYGLSVTGTIHPDRIWTKAGGRPGAVLFLTKPIGTALITTAAKRLQADATHLSEAITAMSTLNRAASELARGFNVQAATDVTGFGLLGHAAEMATKSNVRLTISAASVPLLAGARQYADAGFLCGGLHRNREHFGEPGLRDDGASNGTPPVSFTEEVDDLTRTILWDPQTSGGLLLAIAESDADQFAAAAILASIPVWRVGVVEPGVGVRVEP